MECFKYKNCMFITNQFTYYIGPHNYHNLNNYYVLFLK